MASKRLVGELTGHGGAVSSAAFSRDGARVVTASLDNTARVWDVAGGHLVTVLTGHSAAVFTAAFSPNGASVVTASGDKTARLWEVASGRLVTVLRGHNGPVWCAAFSSDGARVVTASQDKTARVWRLDSLSGEAETFPLWVEVFTGTLWQGGSVRPLSPASWQTRRQKLLNYGSKAPPTPWLLENGRTP